MIFFDFDAERRSMSGSGIGPLGAEGAAYGKNS